MDQTLYDELVKLDGMEKEIREKLTEFRTKTAEFLTLLVKKDGRVNSWDERIYELKKELHLFGYYVKLIKLVNNSNTGKNTPLIYTPVDIGRGALMTTEPDIVGEEGQKLYEFEDTCVLLNEIRYNL